MFSDQKRELKAKFPKQIYSDRQTFLKTHKKASNKYFELTEKKKKLL